MRKLRIKPLPGDEALLKPLGHKTRQKLSEPGWHFHHRRMIFPIIKAFREGNQLRNAKRRAAKRAEQSS